MKRLSERLPKKTSDFPDERIYGGAYSEGQRKNGAQYWPKWQVNEPTLGMNIHINIIIIIIINETTI